MKKILIIPIILGSLFVVLLVSVFAVQWPSLVEKYSVRNTNQAGEVDTSGWMTYRDSAGRYTLHYPGYFYDLEPLGYYTTSDYHSFGPSSTPMQDEPYFEESTQEVILHVIFSKSETKPPQLDTERLKGRYNWFEQSTLLDRAGNQYTYLKYGDVNVDTEPDYALSAFRKTDDGDILNIRLASAKKSPVLKYTSIFEKIIANFDSVP